MKLLIAAYPTLLLVLGLVGMTSLGYPMPLLDAPASTSIAKVILEGGLPYRDAWDARAPGIYFVYVLQLLLLGESSVSLRIFDLLWQICTSLVLASIARRIYRRDAVGVIAGTAYLTFYFTQEFWNWGEPDGFLSLPMALALRFFLVGLECRQLLNWGAAAFFVGVAGLFKIPFALFGVALLVAAVKDDHWQFKRMVRTVSVMALGFSLPLLLCGVYFYAKGGLADLLTVQFVVAPQYVARVHSVISYADFFRTASRSVLLPLYVMAGIGLASLGRSAFRRETIPAPVWLLFAWFGAGVLTLFLHGSFLGYHYLPLAAPLSILSAAWITFGFVAFSNTAKVGKALRVLLIGIFFLVPAVKLRRHATYTWEVLTCGREYDVWRELGSYVRQQTSPSEGFFVWGNAPIIYLHAERRPVSRFLPTAYLSVPWNGVSYRQTLLAELTSSPPEFLVLAKTGAVTPGLPDAWTSFNQFHDLKAFVEANYQAVWDTYNYILYQRRGSGKTPVVLTDPS